MKKMFTKNAYRTALEEERKHLIGELETTSYDDEDYAPLLDALNKVTDLINKDKIKVVTKENAPLVANLVGILLILNYEKANVLTSKAVGFVVKGRV